MIGASEVLQINSRQRLNFSSSTDGNFAVKINTKNPISLYDRVTLLQCSIPKSYYNVAPIANFTLDENGATAVIQMPTGNINRKAFSVVLAQLLNTASPNGWTYTLTYDNALITADSGKWTFAVSGNGGVQPSFIFNASNDSMSQLLGMDTNTNLTKTFSADALISDNIANLQKETTIYINSTIVTENNGVLASVYGAGSEDFNVIKYQCSDVVAFSREMGKNPQNVFQFFITDEDFQPLDFNGINCVFELILFRRADVYNLLLAQLKLKLIKT